MQTPHRNLPRLGITPTTFLQLAIDHCANSLVFMHQIFYSCLSVPWVCLSHNSQFWNTLANLRINHLDIWWLNMMFVTSQVCFLTVEPAQGKQVHTERPWINTAALITAAPYCPIIRSYFLTIFKTYSEVNEVYSFVSYIFLIFSNPNSHSLLRRLNASLNACILSQRKKSIQTEAESNSVWLFSLVWFFSFSWSIGCSAWKCKKQIQ